MLYYGYDFYLLTASDSAHSLPVFPLLDPASMHDSIGFIHAFMAMKAFLPEYKVSRLLLDSAHDNLATYLFCRENGITPFIGLNLKGMKTFEVQGITFSAVDSHPICMNDEKMVRDGVEKKSVYGSNTAALTHGPTYRNALTAMSAAIPATAR